MSSSQDAPKHAVTTIGSVLTGGVVGCINMADALGHRNVISTDMGGTTFLVGLVVDGKPVTTTTTVLNQYTISTPMVDVHTIGAGGGAIAWVDPGGNFKVGPAQCRRPARAQPATATAEPSPTVTDADVVLGIVNPDNFLGGRKKLDRALAEQAIRTNIADPLGLSVDDAAQAIYAIQNAQTADLVRKVVVNSGQDPRDFALYAFGGAGPVHCRQLFRGPRRHRGHRPAGLHGRRLLRLRTGGLRHRAHHRTLAAESTSRPNPTIVNDTFAALEAELHARLAEQGLDFSEIRYEREADLRYTMQMAEVSTPVRSGILDSDADQRYR